MKKKLYIFISFILISLLVVTFNKLRADTPPPELILHPSNLDINLTPGLPTSGDLFLMNTTKQILTIQANLRNFTAQGEEGGVNLTTDNTTYSLASWITIEPTKVVLLPEQEVRFTYTITPPLNAEPGGHFGAIVFATVPSKNVAGSAGSAVSEEIASLILARIPGTVKEEAHVVSFTTDKKFYQSGPVNFTMRVENTGAVHIQPFGTIQITDMFGRIYDAPLQQYNILPGAIRKIPVIFSNHFLIGKYTATIIASYGDKNLPLFGSVVFYAFPVIYGIYVLLALIILFLLRKRIAKAIKMLATGK